MRLLTACLLTLWIAQAFAHEGHFGAEYRVSLDGVVIAETSYIACAGGSSSSFGNCDNHMGWAIRNVDSPQAKAFSKDGMNVEYIQARWLSVFDLTHKKVVLEDCVLPIAPGKNDLFLNTVAAAKKWKLKDRLNPALLRCEHSPKQPVEDDE